MSYKVYKHTNLENGKIYIGITQQKIEKRWQNGYGYKEQTYFYNAIKKYGWDNFKHEILFENLTEEQAIKKEQELIKKYKSNDRNYGYNLSKGGETYKENFKVRIGKENPKSRRIRQLDKKGNLLNIFESQTLASKVLGINRKGITKNCLGQSKTYKGFIFEYDDVDFIKPKKYEQGKHPNHKTTKVKCIDDGKIFKSLKEAGEYYGINASNISVCISPKTKTKTAGGKRWCKWH